MATHSDPTANAAVGSVGREWKRMIRKAISVQRTGRQLTPEEARSFTGIYRRLLEESPETLEKLLHGRE